MNRKKKRGAHLDRRTIILISVGAALAIIIIVAAILLMTRSGGGGKYEEHYSAAMEYYISGDFDSAVEEAQKAYDADATEDAAVLLDDAAGGDEGQARDLREDPQAARGERGVEVLTVGAADAHGAGHHGQVEEGGGADPLEAGLDGARVEPLGQVVAQEEVALGHLPARELLELEGEEAAVGAELDDVVVDVGGDAADHLEELEDGGDVADGDEVLDLEGVERLGRLGEAVRVPLEGGQGLVGAGEDRLAGLEDVALAVDVEGGDLHRLAHRDDRVAGLTGDALGGAVAHAGLGGLDGGGGHELDVGAADAAGARVDDDGAVHLGQLAQPRGGELDIEVESARGDRLDRLVEAEDDDRAGASAQDALEGVAQDGARGDEGEGVAQQVAGVLAHGASWWLRGGADPWGRSAGTASSYPRASCRRRDLCLARRCRAGWFARSRAPVRTGAGPLRRPLRGGSPAGTACPAPVAAPPSPPGERWRG